MLTWFAVGVLIALFGAAIFVKGLEEISEGLKERKEILRRLTGG